MTSLIGNSFIRDYKFQVSNKNNWKKTHNKVLIEPWCTTNNDFLCNIELQDFSDLLTLTKIGTRPYKIRYTVTRHKNW